MRLRVLAAACSTAVWRARCTEPLFLASCLTARRASTVQLVDGVFWGADVKLAAQRVAVGKTRAQDFKFFYSAVHWKPGELEAEMASHKWVASACSKELIVKAPNAWDKPLWRMVLELMGGKFALISRYLSADL